MIFPSEFYKWLKVFGVATGGTGGAQDLQLTYDLSATGNINLALDKHITLTATNAAFRLSTMTNAQFNDITTKLNGLMAWSTDDNRIIVNVGTDITPDYEEVAYLSDVQAVDILQEVYDNSPTGNLNLDAGKDLVLAATDAGFRTPSMTLAQFNAIATLQNGVMAWASDSDRIAINKGTAAVPNVDQLAYLTDITDLQIDAAKGETYFQDNATLTPIAATSTPVQIAGTYLNGDLLGFTQAGGVLTYTDAEARSLAVHVVATVTMDLTTADLVFSVFKNGVIITKSSVPFSVDGVTPAPKPVPITCLIEVVTGDTLDIRVSNETNTDDIRVYSIEFFAVSLGGTSGAEGVDLEAAYTNGDGSIIEVAGKPVALLSTDVAVTPNLVFDQQDVPVANAVIGAINFNSVDNVLSNVNYGRISVEATNLVPAAESSTLRLYGISAGALNQFFQYTGATNTAVFTSDLNLALRSLSDVGIMTQETGSVIFNNTRAIGSFTVKTNNFATAYTVDYATDVANYRIPLTMEAGGYGVNYTMATALTYPTVYPLAVYTSVWTTLSGSATIDAHSFEIGQTVEIDITGVQTVDIPGANSDAGSHFRLTVGSSLTINSNNIALGNSSPRTRPFALKIKITRIDSTNMTISGTGYYYDNAFANVPIWFNVTPISQNYNQALAYPLELEFFNGNSYTTFAFVCKNLNIKKYS